MQSSSNRTMSLKATLGVMSESDATNWIRIKPLDRVPAGTYHGDASDTDYCDIDLLELMYYDGSKYEAHRGYFYVPIDGTETPISCVRKFETSAQFAARARLFARFDFAAVRTPESLDPERLLSPILAWTRQRSFIFGICI